MKDNTMTENASPESSMNATISPTNRSDSDLEKMLYHLDRKYQRFEDFGACVALSQDKDTIFTCPLNSDDLPERAEDADHLNWSEITDPDHDFLQRVNHVFGTFFDSTNLSECDEPV